MFALAFRLNLNAKRPPGNQYVPGGKRIIIINNSSIMAEEQHILYVDLYDNPLTPKAGDPLWLKNNTSFMSTFTTTR